MTDKPDALRDRIAEALMAWTERNANPQYATLRRSETVRQNAYSRTDAVLAVLADHDRDAARTAAKACRCPHPAGEHSVYGCADGCACEWMPKRAARQTTGQDDTGPTPCSVPVACEPGGEPCFRHEREQPHADGEHELCGAERPAVGQPAEAHDTGQHRPPGTNGDHCGEPSHCPPSPAYERLQTIAAKTNREMAGATLRAYKRVYQLAHNATGPIEPSDILEALKDPKPDPAKLLAAIMGDTVEGER